LPRLTAFLGILKETTQNHGRTLPSNKQQPVTPKKEQLVLAAREKCHILYDGVRTGHRSCGIAIAETFGLPTQAYQALRRGGLTGEGPCGAIQAGRLVLGELLGDPDPTGATTPTLLQAMAHYDSGWPELEALEDDNERRPTIICNHLTGRFPIFKSSERHALCTGIARDVATLVAEVLLQEEHPLHVTPIEGVEDYDPKKPQAV
jgi:hypothetical protein